MSPETLQIPTRIALRERNIIQLVIASLFLGDQPIYIQNPEWSEEQKKEWNETKKKEWNDKKIEWIGKNREEISQLIDDPTNTEIRDLIRAERYIEAGLFVFERMNKNRLN